MEHAKMAGPAPNIFSLAGKLLLHIVVGFLVWAVLVVIAVLAHYGASVIDQNNLLSKILVVCLSGAEYVIFFVDCLCLLALIVSEGWRFIMEMFR
jgi:hypothetical protein